MYAWKVPGWLPRAALVALVALGCGDATGPEAPRGG